MSDRPFWAQEEYAGGRPIRVEGGIRIHSAKGAVARTWWSARFIAVLEQVAAQAIRSYGDELVERPEVISEHGELGATTKLTMIAKARFSHGAEVRRALLTDVHHALRAAGIHEAG